jgi:hypothetical protein
MRWFLANKGNVLRDGHFRIKTNYLNPFSIRTINFAIPHEKAQDAIKGKACIAYAGFILA